MKLKRDGYILRFYTWGDINARFMVEDNDLNLCTLFWVVLIKALLILIETTLVGTLLGLWIVEWIVDPWSAFRVIWIPVSAVSAVLAFMFTVFGGIPYTYSRLVHSEFVQFIKGNYCPKIEVE